jgi:hypothetical protein
MEMVHHQDVTVELSTRLLAAQREIESLHTQLRNLDATIGGYQRMIEGHRYLVCHLHNAGFSRGASSWQPLLL